MATTSLERYLTTDEVAEVLRTSADYVARQCRAKNLAGKKVGDGWRIPESAVAAFMAGPTKAPAARKRTARQQRRSAS